MQSFGIWTMLVAAACLLSPPADAQDMMRHVDLSNPMFSSAGMTRAEVEASLRASPKGADFSGKSLNGLDLSRLDFSNANFRAARMNKTNFSHATLDGAVLDQVWAMAADFSGASLRKANLFASQMQEAKCDGADFSGARVAADLSRASL
ncbi:MAG: pentapeptide repeat-containing protein, partial [Methylocella sp.]